jgi:DNA-binding NarL/FixJ family response regulator
MPGVLPTALKLPNALGCHPGPTRASSLEGRCRALFPMLRILIADDHDIVRAGLRVLLERHVGWEVVAEAGDGKQAVSMALQTKPDIVVLDYSMPLINGVEVTRQLRERLPKTEILIFSIHDQEMLIRDLLHAGARAYVLKSDFKDHLHSAIESLAVHKPFFTGKVSEALLDTFLARPMQEGSTVSDTERNIVRLIAEGQTNKEIANSLNISLKTVETRRATIMKKLGFSSTADIVRYAVRNRLVEP